MALLSFHGVSFGYEGAPTDIFDNIDIVFPAGWTGIVGPNGGGKSTLMQLASGLLTPSRGRISRPGAVLYCPQRTDNPPDGLPPFGKGRAGEGYSLADFVEAPDSAAVMYRRRLGIGGDWARRWDTLSHGERKRAQIGVALWREPLVLAVDEPTNHLDAAARALLVDALQSFRGVGLLVSHDRDLLDMLCRQCLFVHPPGVTMRPGGYTEASEQARRVDDRLRDEYRRNRQAAERLAAEAARRREEASRADSKRSKRHLDLRDHDGRSRIDGARVSGADGRAGRLAAQMDGRVTKARQELESIQLQRRHETHFWLPGSRADRPVVLSMPAGSLSLGDGRTLRHPELTVGRADRVVITGPNGAGKSTLIRHLLNSATLSPDRIIYLPQEVDAAESARIMQDVNSLSRDRLGAVMTVVSCLGSRPERLVGNRDVSPGELRKVLLALGIARSPWLIVMDEPTNHLDLPAIESLETALADCPCALLFVSHDARFTSGLMSAGDGDRSEWRLVAGGDEVTLTDTSR